MALYRECTVRAAADGRELVQHGSASFPIAAYEDDLTCCSVAWHWHDDFEFIIAEKGTVVVGVNRKHISLPRGHGIFINSGIMHSVEQSPKEQAILRSAVFHPRLIGGMDTVFWQKLIKPLLQSDAPPYFLLDPAVPWQAQALCSLLDAWKAVCTEQEGYENWVRYRLSEVAGLLNANRPTQVAKLSQQEQVAAERMKQMLRFIDEHFDEELTVERIAGCVALSESACLRNFRQILGTTPIQYVKQYRIEKAAELLRTTNQKVGEIGAECGFADMSYFTKTFKEMKRCTPMEYRSRFNG